MKNNEFIDLCISKLVEYVNSNLDKSDDLINITKDCVYLVWSCKTLQNNKALLSTILSDGMYYEFTYNGDKKELYLDAYKKWQNVCYNFEKEVPTEK